MKGFIRKYRNCPWRRSVAETLTTEKKPRDCKFVHTHLTGDATPRIWRWRFPTTKTWYDDHLSAQKSNLRQPRVKNCLGKKPRAPVYCFYLHFSNDWHVQRCWSSQVKKKSDKAALGALKTDKNLLANLKTAFMLFVVTLVFVVTFCPAFLMALQRAPYNIIVFYLYFANNVANPVIYSFMNQVCFLNVLALMLRLHESRHCLTFSITCNYSFSRSSRH